MPRCIFTRRSVEVSVTGALPAAWTRRPGLSRGERGRGGTQEAGAGAEPEGLWGELQSLQIRKVRISEFLLYFCFQMCHFQSKPWLRMCFWLRMQDPSAAQELRAPFPREGPNPASRGRGHGHWRSPQAWLLIFLSFLLLQVTPAMHAMGTWGHMNGNQNLLCL